MTAEYIQETIDKINERLTQLGQQRNVKLHVENEGTKFEDDWLYVCVETDTENVRVSDFAEVLSEIERELRQNGVDNVLLVPARSG